MWLDQIELSCFSYYECLEIHKNLEPVPVELKDLITDSNYALKYCMNIEDDPDVRKHITDTKDIYDYCLKVKMRIEMIDKMDKNIGGINFLKDMEKLERNLTKNCQIN